MKYTSFIPFYKDTVEQSAGLLRQVIPLLMVNKVPANPINYAIWYEYVGGDNQRLNQKIDTLTRQSKHIDSDVSLDLYKSYVCNGSVEQFEGIDKTLQNIMQETQDALASSGLKAEQAGNRFDESSSKLSDATDIANVKNVLSDITKETRELVVTSKELKSKLDKAQSEMETLRNELVLVREAAITDILTGLLNRRALDDALKEIDSKVNGERQACFILLDLDHFKRINDNFGHLLGDKVLSYTGNLIQKLLPEGYMAARYGGEELVIIAPKVDLDTAKKLADKVRAALSKSILKRKDNSESIGKVTLSAGVASLKPNDSIDDWIGRADAALYKAKEKGRNQVVCERELQL